MKTNESIFLIAAIREGTLCVSARRTRLSGAQWRRK
jgi:hypothetical protein